MRKRIISAILTLAMVVGMLPTMIMEANAASYDVINVNGVTGAQIVAKAREYLGVPYDTSGGDYRSRTGFGSTMMFDCSGFVYRVCREVGLASSRKNYTMGVNDPDGNWLEGQDANGNYYITAHTQEQRYYGEDISAAVKKYMDTGDYSDLHQGDLLFVTANNSTVSHVVIYAGNGRIIHSEGYEGCVAEHNISRYSYSNSNNWFFDGCRLVSSGGSRNTYTVTFDANGGDQPEAFAKNTLDGINVERAAGYLVVYNTSGALVDTNQYGVEVLVDSNNQVIGKRDYLSETKQTVPSDGFIVSGQGKNGSWVLEIELGYYVAYDKNLMEVYVYDTKEAFEANHKRVAVGGTIGLLPTPTRDGYVFEGWYTSEEGGTEITAGHVVTSDMTLYAHWSEYCPKISFDANGGNLPGAYAKNTLDGINVERAAGYLVVYNTSGALVDTNQYGVEVLVDSNNQVIGKRDYLSETKQTVPSDGFIVSGQGKNGSWVLEIELGYYVAYDKNLMEVYVYDTKEAFEANHKRVAVGGTIGLLPTPTRDGYIFEGWYTSAEGGTKISAEYIVTTDMTLYAHWVKDCSDGHSFSYAVTQNPTVAATGLLTGTCTSCSATTTVTLPKLNTTDYSYSVIKAATCTASGTGRYTWKTTAYGSFYFNVSIPAAGHSYQTVVTAPTCTAQGYTTHTCSVCGDSYVDSHTAALGHQMGSWTTVTAPTCTAAGTQRRDCSRCDHYETQSVVATGHSYTSKVTAPTCTTQGYTTHTCSACSDSYMDSHTAALGHQMGNWTTVAAPTCTAAGTQRRDCSRCEHYETQSIAATGHSYTSTVTAPTCTAQGYTTYTCSACGNSYVDSYTAALGHQMGSWTTVTAPTCTAAGTQRRDCSRCDHYETQSIAATGHDWDAGTITTEVTCETDGLKTYSCNACSASYTETIPAVGHNYQGGICANCGEADPDSGVTVLASGSCGATGSSLTWVLYSDGLFCITGTGQMEDFAGSSYVPWVDYLDSITRVEIAEGVTSIGQLAFYSATALESVSIPVSVTAIGRYSFQNATSLKNCVLPDGITTIPYRAFSGASALESIVIPDSVTAIEDSAFTETTSLTACDLPDNLVSIGESAFRRSGLTEIVIPDSVTSVDYLAFDECAALTTIHFGENATYGGSVFSDCNSLTEVYIPSYVSCIDVRMFENCTALEKVVIADGVTAIKNNAFSGCTALRTIEMADSVTTMGTNVFYNCKSLENVALSDNLTALPEFSFYNCDSLQKITIPASVTEIRYAVFASCNTLSEVVFCGDAPTMVDAALEGHRIFYKVTATAYYPAGNTTWTSTNMYSYGGTITWVPYYPVTEVASGWSGDTTWVLTDDGVLTFSGEGNMKNYEYKSEMPWYSYMSQISSVVIEEGVTSIGAYAFYGMNIESIQIPRTVTTIGDYAFKNAAKLDNVVLPSGLTKLGESAFYACSSLTSIEIPASLWTVQPYTFKNCTSLASVTFHDGNLQKISDGAFYGTALTSVELPDCLAILDVYVFKNCSQLAQVKLSSSLTQIREASLYGTAISTIEIPEGVTSIKPYAFKNCVNLVSVSLPSTLTSVDEAAFYACTALKAVELPDSVTAIGNYAFRKCSGLTSVKFGSGLVTIGESSFYGCTGITSLSVPRGVTTIKGYAFKGCTGLISVSLPTTLTTLGESAFHSCTGLSEVIIPAKVTSIGEYCFSGSTGIEIVEFLGNAPSIGTGAFNKITLTAYYPSGNATWTSDIMQNYGGTITWKAQ